MTYPKFLLLVISMLLIHTAKAQMMPEMVSYYSNNKTGISSIAIDTQRKCMYIAGYTADSFGIATPGSHKDTIGPLFPLYGMDLPILFFWNTDIFIAKFDMAGNRLWATYYGGIGKETSPLIRLNSEGDLLLTGLTASEEGITTIGSHQPWKFIDSTTLPFLAKFSKNGVLQWSTYYTNEAVLEGDEGGILNTLITLDNEDNVYISGHGINGIIDPTTGSFQAEHNGLSDGYIAKFDTDGTLIWATYLGGTLKDIPTALDISPDGNLYIAGNTTSFDNLGTVGTYQSNNLAPSGFPERYYYGFINKFTLEGERIWGTYISSSDTTGSDTTNTKSIFVNSISFDQNSNFYLSGITNVDNYISTLGTYRQTKEGENDFFLMKFDNSGQKMWGTYFGSDGHDALGTESESITGDSRMANTPNGNQIYIVGGISSASGSINSSCSLSESGKSFIIRFDGNGNLESLNKYNAYIFNILLDPSNGNNPLQEIYINGRADINGLATEGAFKDNMIGLTYSGIFGRLIETCPDAVPATISYADGTLSIGADYISYNWYHNGVLISDASDHTFSIGADSTGYYYATFQTCACSYYSDTFFFDPLSIQHPSLANNTIDIYPNPSTGHVKVALKNTNTSIQSIQVSDLIGSVLFTVKMLPPATHQYELDISTYPSGIYLVTIMTAHGTHTTKLVKQ